jgi:hypothetical protein
MLMDSLLREALSALGNVVNVESFPSMPILSVTVTISFAGIQIVDMSVSLTREETLFERTMAPFGNLIQQVERLGFMQDE